MDETTPPLAPPRTRVLVAEDDTKTHKAITFLLQRQGYEVVLTCEGRTALDILSRPDPPQIALLDWEMPEMNGVDVCSAVRALVPAPYIYLIIVTARDTTRDMLTAFQAGADDFLTKPADAQELLARMRCGERVLGLEEKLAGRIQEMEEALSEMDQLKRLLPICMYCKKIRGHGESWHQIESYIHEHTGAEFTHGICPGCMKSVVGG